MVVECYIYLIPLPRWEANITIDLIKMDLKMWIGFILLRMKN